MSACAACQGPAAHQCGKCQQHAWCSIKCAASDASHHAEMCFDASRLGKDAHYTILQLKRALELHGRDERSVEAAKLARELDGSFDPPTSTMIEAAAQHAIAAYAQYDPIGRRNRNRRRKGSKSPRGRKKKPTSPGKQRKGSQSPRGRKKKSTSPGKQRKGSQSPRGRKKKSNSPKWRNASASPGIRRKKSVSPGKQRKGSQSPTWRRASVSPGVRRKKSASPAKQRKGSQSPRNRKKKSSSPGARQKQDAPSQSPRGRRKKSASPKQPRSSSKSQPRERSGSKSRGPWREKARSRSESRRRKAIDNMDQATKERILSGKPNESDKRMMADLRMRDKQSARDLRRNASKSPRRQRYSDDESISPRRGRSRSRSSGGSTPRDRSYSPDWVAPTLPARQNTYSDVPPIVYFPTPAVAPTTVVVNTTTTTTGGGAAARRQVYSSSSDSDSESATSGAPDVVAELAVREARSKLDALIEAMKQALP